jgi:flagellar hook-associated protein 3 FlgL
MSVRFSSYQIYKQGLNSLLDVQNAVSKTQQQISTGKRVLTPGDDPVASTRILALTQELKLNALYNNNANNLQNKLERADVALSNVSDLLQRAQELVIQAGDGALNAEQRGFIATEMEGIVESMATSMNSRDGNGNFIFAGLQVNRQPFVKAGDGRYEYRGDEGQRTIQLGAGSFVRANESGRKLFMEIPSSTLTAEARANPRNSAVPPAVVSTPLVLDQEQFDTFYPEDAVIEFRPLDEFSPAAPTFTIKQVSDGRIIAKNVPYKSGELIEFAGMGVRVSGNPAPGDTFMISSTDKKGLLTTLEEFSTQLRTLTDSASDRSTLGVQVDNTLANLENAQTVLLEGQSAVGSRLNLIENVRNSNEDIRLATQESLSELQDLDFAEAVSRLSQESFILEAAQASFARVSGLTLFNYIN